MGSLMSKIDSIAAAFRKEATEWPLWWSLLSLPQRLLPLLLVLLYWAVLVFLHGFRSDHLTIGLLILAGSYGGRTARKGLRFFLPLLLTAIVYDSQRFYADYIRGPVHVREPYEFDKRFFGISTATGTYTPNEWFEMHTVPFLDVITGFFYLTFVPIFVGIAAYFSFWARPEVRAMAPRMMWAFLWVNVVGYTTYYWYAAAPPWYVALHGFGPARMDTLANAAGCVRFDHILGTKFFTEWYGRSADVFGAIPSLHVAYPLQAVYFSFKFGAVRKFSIFFYIIMCFSAVYLNHHYVLDVLLGSLYAIVVTCVTDFVFERRRLRAAQDSKALAS